MLSLESIFVMSSLMCPSRGCYLTLLCMPSPIVYQYWHRKGTNPVAEPIMTKCMTHMHHKTPWVIVQHQIKSYISPWRLLMIHYVCLFHSKLSSSNAPPNKSMVFLSGIYLVMTSVVHCARLGMTTFRTHRITVQVSQKNRFGLSDWY